MSFESTAEERVGVDGADRWRKTVPHHTPGSQTEKARLPNWARVLCIAAALVVVERTCRCETVSRLSSNTNAIRTRWAFRSCCMLIRCGRIIFVRVEKHASIYLSSTAWQTDNITNTLAYWQCTGIRLQIFVA